LHGKAASAGSLLESRTQATDFTRPVPWVELVRARAETTAPLHAGTNLPLRPFTGPGAASVAAKKASRSPPAASAGFHAAVSNAEPGERQGWSVFLRCFVCVWRFRGLGEDLARATPGLPFRGRRGLLAARLRCNSPFWILPLLARTRHPPICLIFALLRRKHHHAHAAFRPLLSRRTKKRREAREVVSRLTLFAWAPQRQRAFFQAQKRRGERKKYKAPLGPPSVGTTRPGVLTSLQEKKAQKENSASARWTAGRGALRSAGARILRKLLREPRAALAASGPLERKRAAFPLLRRPGSPPRARSFLITKNGPLARLGNLTGQLDHVLGFLPPEGGQGRSDAFHTSTKQGDGG